jgi:hypothetical protein
MSLLQSPIWMEGMNSTVLHGMHWIDHLGPSPMQPLAQYLIPWLMDRKYEDWGIIVNAEPDCRWHHFTLLLYRDLCCWTVKLQPFSCWRVKILCRYFRLFCYCRFLKFVMVHVLPPVSWWGKQCGTCTAARSKVLRNSFTLIGLEGHFNYGSNWSFHG